jgi:hypothetical protein
VAKMIDVRRVEVGQPGEFSALPNKEAILRGSSRKLARKHASYSKSSCRMCRSSKRSRNKDRMTFRVKIFHPMCGQDAHQVLR